MKLLLAIWKWFDERSGIGAIVVPLASHLVPSGSRWWYVFGSATLFAFLVQVVTGIALATIYVPSTAHAYASLRYLSEVAPLGAWVRGMHYFGASAMIVFVGAHMTRVFLMASYKYPREVNWLSGVGLLALTLGMGFTGQLLRWDQNAVWSTVVGASQAARMPLLGPWLVRVVLSGATIGDATLSHFFVLHVFVLPLLIAGLVGLHLHLVLRNGISEPPSAGRPVDPASYRASYDAMLAREGVPFWPHAAWRDVTFGVLVVAGIAVLGLLIGAPALDRPPDPSLAQATPRPDWYLLWYFAVLALLPHAAEDYVMVLAPLLVGLLLLSPPFLSNRGERSMRRRPWAPLLVLFALTCIGVLWRAGARERWMPDFAALPLTTESVGERSGQLPAGAAVFNTKGCLYCHAVSGRGGTRGPDLTDVGRRLSRDQIVVRILNGGPNMPAYANNLAPQQLDTLVVFLESRSRP